MTECKRCICDDKFPDISFDEEGICNYCRKHEEMDKLYPISEKRLDAIANDIKRHSKNKKHNCIVGVSGGKDSSYLLFLAIKLGLKPVAVHYDNGWDTEIAKKNIVRMVSELKVPIVNYKVNQDEVDDLIKAFLFSYTQDAEAATDLGLAKCLLKTAHDYNVKYILDGHSFRTEGFAPLKWSYMDWKYVESVHKKFGKVPLKTYPKLTLMDQLKYGWEGYKRPRLLYHIDYNSQRVRRLLENSFGWEWYGGHHLENTYTAFFDYYYRFNKLGFDGRIVELSALIRSGQLDREKAKQIIEEPVLPKYLEESILEEIKDRLDIGNGEMWAIMYPGNKRTHHDWPTYKKHFKMLKPVFWMMAKTNRIPYTFYMKYCKGV